MNPVKIGVGKSFKGLAAYLLHDTKDMGEEAAGLQHQTTANRVGWCQSYNLDGAEPEQAWRLMAQTAMSANDLKAAAGLKKGKTPVNTVYHFAITFPPADQTDEQLERKAVSEALDALKMSEYQALAIRHTDTDHAHIHVMVNLIHPETGMSAASKQNGKAALLSNDTRRLSSWAQKFEREHGLTITDGRLENANARAQGEHVDAKRKPRNVVDRDRTETQDERRDYIKDRKKEEAAALAQQGRDNERERHEQLLTLKIGYQQQKFSNHVAAQASMHAAINQVKIDHAGHWEALSVRHRSERADFYRDDKTAIGKIWHAAAVIKESALHHDVLGGFVAAFSRDARVAVIERRQARERRELGAKIGVKIARVIRAERQAAEIDRANARADYQDLRQKVKAVHDQQRTDLKQKWRELNQARREALQPTQRAQPERGQGRGWDQWQGRGRGLTPD